MSTDPTTTDDTVPADEIISDADAEAVEGRSRVVLPPRTPDPAELLADQQAAETVPQPEAPPTYADMEHLLPR